VKSAKWKAQSEKWKRKAKARFNAPQMIHPTAKVSTCLLGTRWYNF